MTQFEIQELRSPLYRTGEMLAIVVAFTFLFNIGTGVLLGHQSDVRAPFSDSRVLLMQVVAYGAISIFIFPWWKKILLCLWNMKPIALLLIMAGLSTAWSHAPVVTLRRFPALIATSVVGVFLGLRFSVAKQVWVITFVLGLAATGSLLLAVLVPSIGVDHGLHAGAWQGLFEQKNVLGKVMTLCFLSSAVALSDFRRDRRFVAAGVALLSLGLVFKSTSRTAWVVTAVLMASYLISRMRKWRIADAAPILLFAGLLAISGYTWVKTNSASVLAASGRDTTLSGRSSLWMAVGMAIEQRPLLGYGFDAFWMDDIGPNMIVVQNVQWNPPHSHNGLLDLILHLGYIGAALFLFGFVITVFKASRRMLASDSDVDVWPLLFLIYLLCNNVTESCLLTVNSYGWMVYLSVATSVWAVPRLYRRSVEHSVFAEVYPVVSKVGILQSWPAQSSPIFD